MNHDTTQSLVGLTETHPATSGPRSSPRNAPRCGPQSASRYARGFAAQPARGVAVAPGRAARQAGPAQARGSALLMVVVAIVLMVMMGAAYLQVARMQRAVPVEPPNNIDLIRDSVINEIRRQLLRDVVTADGVFFDQNAGIEPFDYPWTNPDEMRNVDGINNPYQTAGGLFDDTWLASTAPVWDGSQWVWPHISSLSGGFFNVTNSTNPQERYVAPGSSMQDFGFRSQDFTGTDGFYNVPLTHAQLVDITGNGIGDGFWERAPIMLMTGVEYFAAVRIVDLSSKANISTALGLTDTGGVKDVGPQGTDAPRWHSPSELDIAQFVQGFGTYNANELLTHLDYRLKDQQGGALGFSLISRADRDLFWHEAGRYAVGDIPSGSGPLSGLNRRHYGVQSAFDLLYREGLNSFQTSTTISDHMPNFLRNNSGVNEVRYNDVVGVGAGQYGVFFQEDPRKQMSPFGGAVDFKTPDPGVGFAAYANALKVDVNRAIQTGTYSEVTDVVADAFAGAPLTSLPGNSDGDLFTNTQQFAAQLSANLRDYIDNNNRVTRIERGGIAYYGLEALPFIAEVYAQGKYTTTSIELSDDPPEYFGLMTLQGPVGWAVEIRNPFNHPADLTTVELWWNDGDSAGQFGADVISSLPGVPDTLGPGQVLILYQHSNNDADNDDDVTVHISGAPDFQVEIPSGIFVWPTIPGNPGTLDFELMNIELRFLTQAEDGSNNPIAADFGYSVAPAFKMPETGRANAIPVDDTNIWEGQTVYVQHAMIGNGNGLNTMLVARDDFFFNQNGPADGLGPATYVSSNFTALGIENKPSAIPGAPNDRIDLTEQQIILRNDAQNRLLNIGELAHLLILGPRPDEAQPGVPSDTSYGRNFEGVTSVDLDQYRLDFTGNELVGTGNYAIPHAALLLDRLTTRRTTLHGGTHELVPGTINLNTMPYHTLARVLPIPNDTLRASVARAIVAYRDMYDPETNSAVIRDAARDIPGIASVGELFNDADSILRGTADASDPRLFWPGNTGTDLFRINDVGGDVRVDFLANRADLSPERDGVIDDREELTMIARWLSQVGSTRSDYFAAYILIHGYRSETIQAGAQPEAVETGRYIVIFSRADVTDADSEVEVVGMFEF